MTTPLPFAWSYWLVFWPVYIWVFIPEFRLSRRTFRGKAAPPEDRGSLRVLLAGFSFAVLAAFVTPFAVPQAAFPGNRIVWFLLGLLALVAGGLLRRHCFRVLGRFFTGAVEIQSGHVVIESGAYRFVRHPSYSAALLIVLGIALCLGNWLGAVVSLATAFLAYSYRAQVEERALLASLGEPYARYLASRKRFIPYVC
jgi:protein-S-isoprenylcysteine O-methyltransferase Ste14